jgi:hypothetical protein
VLEYIKKNIYINIKERRYFAERSEKLSLFATGDKKVWLMTTKPFRSIIILFLFHLFFLL